MKTVNLDVFILISNKKTIYTVLNDIHDDHCPDDYLYCGSKYCIYHDLVCEGIIQCYPSSLICNDKSKFISFKFNQYGN